MNPAHIDEPLARMAERLFSAVMSINSAEQVLQHSGTSLARHAERSLRDAVDELDSVLQEIRRLSAEDVMAPRPVSARSGLAGVQESQDTVASRAAPLNR